MTKVTKLIIDPKKWLGDNKILKMDWDVKAMHFHLMLLAWQNEPQGYIEFKDVGKYLNIDINGDDWKNRISQQLKSVWQKKIIEIDNQSNEYYYQPGLIKEVEKQLKPKVSKVKKEVIDIVKDDNNEDVEKGFMLLDIIDDNKSLLTEEEKKENNNILWNIGVQLLVTDKFNMVRARGFIAKLLKEYGSEKLIEGIKQLMVKNIPPIDSKSYLVSILRNGIFTKEKPKLNTYQKVQHNQASGRLII